MATLAPTRETEAEQVERANESGRTPVVFVHGLWLLPPSWDPWAELFEEGGFAPVAATWPGDQETVAEARAHPETLAGKGLGTVADHHAALIDRLDEKPVVVGHSFGGLLTEILAGRGLARASVAISPAPFRGVLALPLSALRAAWPVLRNPANRNRSVLLTYAQFRFAFANALAEQEARALYETQSVPAPGKPIFEAATANLNPRTPAKVDTASPQRGPLLILSADRDNTVPWAIANASYRKQRRNENVTEIAKLEGRGHALTIDSGWRDVAATALAFVRRFA
jgi:non-heme chloroperoxidase